MIIAVDFDGVLCEDRFPYIGRPKEQVIELIKQLIDQGHEVILWTSRTDNELENAVRWCKWMGLNFCSVNENAPSNIAQYQSMYPNGTRKVYADYYIDDHNLEWAARGKVSGYHRMVECLRSLCKEGNNNAR